MNTIISFLKNSFATEIVNFLEAYNIKFYHDPVGGWREWGYDQEFSKEWFFETRHRIIPNFVKLCDESNYVEIGFGNLPYIEELKKTTNWLILGVTEHPLTWIPKAYNKIFLSPGDGMSYTPKSYKDYARIWTVFTKRIINNSSEYYRCEDLAKDMSPFLSHFGITKSEKKLHVEEITPQSSDITNEIWKEVGSFAECLGYYKDKNNGKKNFISEKKDIKNINLLSCVSIIIAARNYGEYIEDTISSAISQSMKPLEIIYVDDGSDDDSVKRVETKFPSVKIFAQPKQGVVASRNLGIQESHGDYLLFLDGDDIIPHNYIEKKLNTLNKHPEADFIYSPSQAFGSDNHYVDVPDLTDPKIVWYGNFVNTSSLFKKKSLYEVGLWQPVLGTSWDWDLLFRLIKGGFKGVPCRECFLLYRHHPKSRSYTLGQKSNDDRADYVRFFVRNKFATRFIGCILSDRVFALFDQWMQAIVRNIDYYCNQLNNAPILDEFDAIKHKIIYPALNILYTGQKDISEVANIISKYKNKFKEIRLECEPFICTYKEEQERRNKVSKFLTKSYNRLLEMDSDIAWFVEDDIIPPDNAYYDMLFNLLKTPLYAVSGVYRNRHNSTYLLHNWIGGLNKVSEYHTLPSHYFCDITGTGCLMIFRPYASHKFTSHIEGIPAHDWAWCMKLKEYEDLHHPKSKSVYIAKNVICKHYTNCNYYI